MTPKQALRSVKANQARKAARKAELEVAKKARWSLPIERHADRVGLFYSDGTPIDKDDPRLGRDGNYYRIEMLTGRRPPDYSARSSWIE